ncbi:MAG: YciI family protein [Chitinophagaceae bacterium]
MKDFMLIFIGGSSSGDLSPEEMQANMQQWFDWINDLKAKGTYISGEALMPGGKTVKGPKALITDGPFAESKELIGGYFIIQAASLEAAAEVAKGCPDLPLNSIVEVREVMKFE